MVFEEELLEAVLEPLSEPPCLLKSLVLVLLSLQDLLQVIPRASIVDHT